MSSSRTSTARVARCPPCSPPPTTRRRSCCAGRARRPPGATREHFRGLGLELVPGSGPLAAAIPGAVDAWLMLGRDHGTRSLRDVLSYAVGYARHGHPLLPRAAATVGDDGADVHRALAHVGGPVAAARTTPAAVGARRQHGVRRRPRPARRRRRECGRGSRDAVRRCAARLARGLRRGGDRRLPATAVPGLQRRRPCGRDDGAGPGGLERVVRAGGRPSSFRGFEVAKTNLWGAGPGPAAVPGDARPAAGRRPRPVDRRRRARHHRGAQARVRRPRGLVRRRQRRVRRRAPRPGVRRPAALPGRETSPRAELRPGSPGGRRAEAGRSTCVHASSMPEAAGLGEPTITLDRRDAAATPATSTSSTAGATSSRRPRAAAGCRARRPCPSSGSASAAGCRCSGWTTGCPSSLTPGRPPAHDALADAGAPRRASRCYAVRHAGR